MIYKSDETIEPFWAESSSSASGRDPLAIQNSSVVIYAKMVVGITNVTNRIRYNGFYCWMLETILRNIEKRNSLDEQIRFLRRGELLLAYLMVERFPKATGVSGSFYAGKNRATFIDLKSGADWDNANDNKTDLYWQYKEGVFGQYYSGVIQELDLIQHPGNILNIYTLTEKGKELGAAFEDSLSDNAGKLFWDSVYTGTIAVTDIGHIASFALHLVPPDSAEAQFYERMLLKGDDRKVQPTYHRSDTIKLLLSYLDKNPGEYNNLPLAFLRENYEQQKKNTFASGTVTAWYLYEINELIHFAFEYFHACFLYTTELYPTPIQPLFRSLVEDVKMAAEQEGLNIDFTPLEKLREATDKNGESAHHYSEEMRISFNNEDFGYCLLNSVRTILSVWNDCKQQLSELKAFAQLPEYTFDRPGYAIDLLQELVESKLSYTISQYIEAILLMAINRHTFSSYGKTKLGQRLVHNYLIEENSVRKLRETMPNRTSPRLQNVEQYITDIGWLRKDNNGISITDKGREQIRNI